ncbi:MAG TPA: hypothetical protein PLV86_09055 [Candidatus Fermentibacter daniensis]|jgi:hypothetical protein|nr:hypothetical protein [Candidatus Fermentibacter daniensis]HQM41888.1 hypothetical protein [Candidatus Fermentibacter daniensis]
MSEQEERELIERIKAYTESISGSPEKALEGLVAAGICTPDGKLAEPYRDTHKET